MKVILRLKNHETKRYRKTFENDCGYRGCTFMDSEHLPTEISQSWVRIDSINVLGDDIYVSITPPKRKKEKTV